MRIEHLGALELVYSGVIESHRKAIDATEDSDPVTQDMLIGQAAQLELFHWFVRAHLESASGELSTAGDHAARPRRPSRPVPRSSASADPRPWRSER